MDSIMPMRRIGAYCGLICTDCEAYVATQADDQAALEQVAAKWREEYDAPNLTVADVVCDGCLVEGRKCNHCAECDIRACGIERGVANCQGAFGVVSDDQLIIGQSIAQEDPCCLRGQMHPTAPSMPATSCSATLALRPRCRRRWTESASHCRYG